jgi:hypothetical protein
MAVFQSRRRVRPPRRDRSRPRVASHCLLHRCLEDLLSHAVADDVPCPAGDRGPLVIVDPAGGGATRAIARVMLDPATRTLPACPLPALATIWEGRSLGHSIARAIASDHLQRLTAAFLARPIAVIDDVDRLGRREVQAAFVHLFDTATTAGTALCLSIARPPTALDCLEHAVASRLAGGLVVGPPSATPEDRFAGHGGTSVSLARVLRSVARHHDLDVATLVGPSRRRVIAEARGLAMYVARAVTGSSLQAIGDACGGRDHTTALHATRTLANRIAADPAFAADVERLIERVVGRVSEHRRAPRRPTSDIAVDT